ncbi:DUF4349 domain-containing protein [Maricaulis maris]|uniref:Uncharacterized protein DUF4349 n=1 Tax=Maricaulis maris TaxID=74318 RepID=A0A495DFW4_9PROT|nr:DUF4349 domain-containing protein [Maricaulis maris]RKR00344.1 uncharacterized protein DUF4349 [Maricaulis maris]
MKPIVLACLASLTLVAACENSAPQDDAEYGESLSMFDAGDAVMEASSYAPAAPPPPPPSPTRAGMTDSERSGNPDTAPDTRLIAYSYSYQLETPAAATSGLIDTHREACLSAGPEVCQVVNANIYQQGDHGVAGSLALRAVPAWIDTFRAGLGGQLETAAGRIRHQAQDAEDLTAAIVDLEARLEAKQTLRTRLTTLLERPGATVEELVQVERELARLQGDIEGSQARVRAMRGRVSMSSLTVNYSSRVDPVSRSAFDPLGRALRNLTGNFASGLADVLTFIAGALPWLVVILPVGWLSARWIGGMMRRRRDQKQS